MVYSLQQKLPLAEITKLCAYLTVSLEHKKCKVIVYYNSLELDIVSEGGHQRWYPLWQEKSAGSHGEPENLAKKQEK